MANVDLLSIMKSKQVDPIKFQFDIMQIPPISYFLSDQDIRDLREIATSLRLSAKIDIKRKLIDDIMRRRGFKRFQAGTNRIIYKFEESQAFVAKIAIDRVGLKDNPNEFKNQELLKPFVAKTFHVSDCGTVALSERVEPIIRPSEFELISEDVYELITNKILGLYVMEDIGTKYFMNWGTRVGFGPVLLDYPYLFELDGDKLFCNVTDPITNIPCNGEIDYDDGFNELICKKCGKRYLARDLKRNITENNVIMNTIIGGGKYPMIVQIKRGNEVISKSDSATDTIVKPPRMRKVKKNRFNKTEMNVVINNYRPRNPVKNVNEEEIIDTKNEINEKIVKVSMDATVEPVKVNDSGFKTVITGGGIVKNDRDLNVKVLKGNINQNKKTVIKEEVKNDITSKIAEKKDTEKEVEIKEEVKKEEIKEEAKNDVVAVTTKKMMLINKKIKLSGADQVINKKICDGDYYFDENGVLRKADGSVYKGKNLRLKASDYAPATTEENEDY